LAFWALRVLGFLGSSSQKRTRHQKGFSFLVLQVDFAFDRNSAGNCGRCGVGGSRWLEDCRMGAG